MEMPTWEIVERYRTAKDPTKQVGILADLNGVQPKEIRRILIGCGILPEPERRKPGGHKCDKVLAKMVGDKIAEILEENNLTQREFARNVKTNNTSVSYYLKGERLPSVETLILIADTYNVTTDELLGRKER